MSSNSCIIPECYIDSCLAEVLLNAGKDHVNHQKGNGTVAREMRNEFNDSFCVGIIDEDRKLLDYLMEFNILNETNYLRLWKHRGKHHYMIQLRPVVENWILQACERAGITPKEFDLPESLTDLMKVSKSVASKRDPRFIGSFRALIIKNAESILQLQKWLAYLNANKYKVDINQLTNG